MWAPLLLTLLGAAGTGLGGLLVVLQPHMDFRRLGVLQGLAAGLMLSLSLMDLLPEAAQEIGFIPANLCFYAGVAFFALIVAFIPEPGDAFFAPAAAAGGVAHQQAQQQEGGSKPWSSSREAPAGSRCDSTTAERSPSPPAAAVRARRRSAAAAGAASPAPARLDVSSAGLAPAGDRQQQQQQQQQQGLQLGSPSTPGSCEEDAPDLQVVLLRKPDADGSDGKERSQRDRQQLLMSGLITAVGIALHNFPEGISVYLASQKSSAVGISLGVAIALHNIPEGVATALPVYFATGSRLQGLMTAVLSGLAEPAAVLLLGLLFPFLPINKHVVDGMLAGVGGIMAFLAFHELLPLAVQHAGKGTAVGCMFAGMCCMSVTLHVLNTHVLAGLHH